MTRSTTTSGGAFGARAYCNERAPNWGRTARQDYFDILVASSSPTGR